MRAARAMAFTLPRKAKGIVRGGISSSVRQFQYLALPKGRSSTANADPCLKRWSSSDTSETKKKSGGGGGLWTRLAKWLEGPDEIRVERAKKILDSIEGQITTDDSTRRFLMAIAPLMRFAAVTAALSAVDSFPRIVSTVLYSRAKSALSAPPSALHLTQARLDFSSTCGLDQGKFRHQFALEMLHLWILKLNLVAADKTEGAKLFAEICEQVWARTEPRLYKEGVLSLMLSKNLKEVQQWTFGSMTAYDKAVVALQNDDSDAELIGALWRNVFDCEQDAKPEHVATLADYALDQIEGLQQTDVQQQQQQQQQQMS
eukprot:jgi/Bigna1/81100/fgenesh1_pg.77_\